MITSNIHLFNKPPNSSRGEVDVSVNLGFDRSEVFSALLTANQQAQTKEKSVAPSKSALPKIAPQQNKSDDAPSSTAIEQKERSIVKPKPPVSADDKSSFAENNNGIEQTSQAGVVSDPSQGENKDKQDQSPSEIEQAEQATLALTQAGLQPTQRYLPALAGQVTDISGGAINALTAGANPAAHLVLDNKSLSAVTEAASSYVNKIVTDGRTGPTQAGQSADNGKFFHQTLLSQSGLDALAQGSVSGDNERLDDQFALLPTALPKAAMMNGIMPAGLDFTHQMQTSGFMESNDRYLSTLSKTSGAALSSPVFTLPTQVGQLGWGGEFNKRITMMFNHNVQQATLRLHPQELGQIDVRISINQDQASVVFVSQHGMVKEVIEAALPKLRDMLAESGIHLANADVGSQSAFSRQQDNAEQQNQEIDVSKFNADDSTDEGAMNAQSMVIKQADNLVDYFA